MKPPVEAPTSAQSRPSTSTANAANAVASFSPPRETNGGGRSTRSSTVGVHLLARLVVPLNEPREDERLSLAPRLGQTPLHEEDVEPLPDGFQRGPARELVAPGGEQMPTWLLVLIIVLVVLALFGGFGYCRR